MLERPTLDFGGLRVTPATIWREHREQFEPHYHLDQNTHRYHRMVERADSDLGHGTADDRLELDLWADALNKSVQGALNLDGTPLDEKAVKTVLQRGPYEGATGRELEALRYAGFYDELTELLRNPPLDPNDPLVAFRIETPERFIERFRPSTLRDILALHRKLFLGILPDAGEFKRAPTFLGNEQGEVTYVAAMPEHVEAELGALLQWLGEAWEHPLVRIEVFLHEFLSIDPFRAGSTRVAIALHTLLLASMGYRSAVYAPVAHQVFRTSDDYRTAFLDGQRSGDLTPWVAYMAKAVIEAYAEPADRALFRRVLPRDLEPRLLRIAEEFARFHWACPGEVLGLGDIENMNRGIPRRTLQRDLQRLCDAGVLRRSGTNKGAKYALAV